VVADPRAQPQIGWGLNAQYSHQEGAYFGNIFVSPPLLFDCSGRDVYVNPPPGRLGSLTSIPPYKNPAGFNAYCAPYCTASDFPNYMSGFRSCFGYNAVMTVWRK